MIKISFLISDGELNRMNSVLKSTNISHLKIEQRGQSTHDRLMFKILELICLERNVNPFDVLAQDRKTEAKMTRHIFTHIILKLFPSWRQRKISLFLGKDRTTVINSRDYIHDRLTGIVSQLPENKELAMNIYNYLMLIEDNQEIQQLKNAQQ